MAATLCVHYVTAKIIALQMGSALKIMKLANYVVVVIQYTISLLPTTYTKYVTSKITALKGLEMVKLNKVNIRSKGKCLRIRDGQTQ